MRPLSLSAPEAHPRDARRPNEPSRAVATWDDVRRIALALPETSERISRDLRQRRVRTSCLSGARSSGRVSSTRRQGGAAGPRRGRPLHHAPLRRLPDHPGPPRPDRHGRPRRGDRGGGSPAHRSCSLRSMGTDGLSRRSTQACLVPALRSVCDRQNSLHPAISGSRHARRRTMLVRTR